MDFSGIFGFETGACFNCFAIRSILVYLDCYYYYYRYNFYYDRHTLFDITRIPTATFLTVIVVDSV